jgi:putative ABC transport system permease protein
MLRLLALSSSRFYRRHPWQLGLAVAGVALGVAVYVGVDLATNSARRAFELSADLVRGDATHRLLGVNADIDEAIYRDLVVQRGMIAAPVIELEVDVLAPVRRRVTLLGIDPLEETGFRTFSSYAPRRATGFNELLTTPGAALLPVALASELGLGPGSSLRVDVGTQIAELTVVGSLIETGDANPPIVTDISTAQELGRLRGRLHRIDLKLSEDAANSLRQSLPLGTTLVESGSEDRSLRDLTDAFQTNLTALGLLALVVGMFLIYSTISFSIVQRRRTIGMLRAIGITRKELIAVMGVEALGIGAIGTTIGIAAGDLLARSLVDLVLDTIGDFYFRSGLQDIGPSPLIYLEGFILGFVATAAAAAGPLIDAARVSPVAAIQRATLERDMRRRFLILALLSIPLSAAAVALLWVDPRSLATAFTALCLVLVAGAFVVPHLTAYMMRLVEPVARRVFDLPGSLAVRGVVSSLSRTGVATAALSVAVATVIGIGIMVASFRISLVDWLDSTLTADVYINSFSDAGIDTALLDRIETLDGVEGLSRSVLVRLATEQGTIGMRAAQPGPDGWGLDIVDGSPEDTTAALVSTTAVAISEPFAFRYGYERGDELALPTANGLRSFPIAGIYRDYNAGGAAVETSLATYRREWDDDRLSTAGIHIESGAEEAVVEERIRSVLLDSRDLTMRSTRFIEELSLRIFDRTFQITDVLRVLAAIIAFLGILSALLALQLERAREFGVLRSLGFTPRDSARLVMVQTGLLGAAAGITAIPLGTVLAVLLVYVINRRSFGWSMDLTVTPQPILYGLALAAGAAILAGIYPSYVLAKGNLNRALQDE